jgi:SAM-dependent MidA family methyltransferase
LNPLVEKILAEIRDQGPISFARFMEWVLYCPDYGYYEREEDTLGPRGDYFTSVSVGPLFGELMALQFAGWLEAVQSREPSGLDFPLQIVEAGAHRGHLARDILTWLRRHRTALFDRLEYWIVEPSPLRQRWQRDTLGEFIERVRWVADLPRLRSIRSGGSRSLEARNVSGVIFSNELLDAMPVHRLGWDAKREVWFEWGVTFVEGCFRFARLPEPIAAPEQAIARARTGSEHLIVLSSWADVTPRGLPDGFTVDFCPAASQWWADAAEILECGKLLTIDYGLSANELFLPERAGGTARAYYRHHAVVDLLANPGEQDITAHVNFSEIRQVGEKAGLRTDGFFAQEEFLTRIAAPIFEGQTRFPEWTKEQTRQFQTLTHPEHLGRAFRVLVQSR